MAQRFNNINNKSKTSKKSRNLGGNWRTLIDSDTVDLSQIAEARKSGNPEPKVKKIKIMKDVGMHSETDGMQLREAFLNSKDLEDYALRAGEAIKDPTENIFSEYIDEIENFRPLAKAAVLSEEKLSKEILSDELSQIDDKDLRIREQIIKTASFEEPIAEPKTSILKKSSFKFIPREPEEVEKNIEDINFKAELAKQKKKDKVKEKIEVKAEPLKKEQSPKTLHPRPASPVLKKNKTNSLAKKAVLASLALSFVITGAAATQKVSALKRDGQQHAQLAYKYMQSGQEALFELDTERAEENFIKAKEEFEAVEKKFTFLGQSTVNLSASFPVQSELTSVSHLLRAGKLYAMAGYEASGALSSLQNANTSLNGNEDESYFTDSIVLAGLGLKKAGEYLKDADAEISSVRPEDIPTEFEKEIRLLQSKTGEVETLFEETFSSLDMLLTFLGHNRPKNYILIFQNNSELRATGGFIGTYGLLKINKGSMEELFIDGIYNPDGQLKVNEFFVIPPEPLQYVTPYWGTRDANWFFDFPTSAEKIAWFYSRTGGPPPGETSFPPDVKADGVIGINTTVFTKLLNLAGPIEMQDYGVTLTGDNWLELVQKEVEEDYDKELNRPKQILADMAPILIERLGEHDKKIDIINIFLESLERKDVLVYSRDADVNEFMAGQGWDGAIKDSDGSAESIEDYLAVVISNIGGWKTDIYTNTEVDTVTKVSDSGEVTRTVIISRKHNGGSTPYKWYNKPNHGYLRIYVPKGSELVSAEGFSSAPPYINTDYEAEGYLEDELVTAINSTAWKAENGTDVFEESGKTVFGNWMWIPAGERVLATLTYKLPHTIEKETGSYGLVIQKQSGIDIKYSGSVEEFDSTLDVASCYKDAVALAGGQFKFVLQKDIRISCSLNH